jgi:hypothetical protein
MHQVLLQVDARATYVFSFMVSQSGTDVVDFEALTMLESICDTLTKDLFSGRFNEEKSRTSDSGQQKKHAVMTLQKLVGIYHRLLESENEAISARKRQNMTQAKRKLDDVVFRLRNTETAPDGNASKPPMARASGREKFKRQKLDRMSKEAKEYS